MYRGRRRSPNRARLVTGTAGLNSAGNNGNDCRVVGGGGRGLLGEEPADLGEKPGRLGDPDAEQVEERAARLQLGDGLLGLREVVGVEAPEQAAVDEHQSLQVLRSRGGR